MHFALRLGRDAFFCYISILAVLIYFQESLIFVGSTFSDEPLPSELPAGISVEFMQRATEGKSVPARIAVGEPQGKVKGVLVFFGGNGETFPALLYRCRQLREYGYLVLAPEPPGYGATPGPMGKDASILTADLIGDIAVSRARELGVPVVTVGSSIGTFSAIHLGATDVASKVVLHAPLTSLSEVASKLYWWVPVGYLLNENLRYDNAEELIALREIAEARAHKQAKGAETAGGRQSKEAPMVLVIHGDQDEIVPMDLGARVCDALAPHCQFLRVKGANHNDVPLDFRGPFGQQIAQFLST